MANPNPNPNPSNPIARVYDEVIDKNIERLMELLKKLIEAFKNIGVGGGVTKQLEKLSKEIKEQAENGKIQNEVIDDLVALTHEIDGKLETLTPETVKEVMNFVEEKTKEVVDKYNSKVIEEEKIEPDFLTALKELTGKKEMKDEEFKKLFDKKAVLLTKDGKITDNITVNFEGKNYDVSFQFEKGDDGKLKNIMKVEENKEDVSSYQKAEINASLSDYSTSAKIIISLANKQGFCTDTQAKVKIAKEMNKVFSSSVEKSIANFISKRTDKVITSENGRFESTYNKDDGTLRIRDRSTSEVLVIAPQKNGQIILKTVNDVQDINKIPNGKKDKIGNIAYNTNLNKTVISLQFPSQNVSTLFHSKECIEFLSLNGVHKETIDALLNSCNKDSKGAYPVSEQGMNNVNKLKAELEKEIQNFGDKYKDFQVSIVQGKKKNPFKKESKKGNSAVYLRVTDCHGDVMSFAFRKDGIPSNICFKEKNEKDFRQVYNFNTKNINEIEKLQKNPEFALSLNLCKIATNNFAKKLSEPVLAQGLLISEPAMPKITNIRNVPKELQIFSNPNNAMSIVPNKVAVNAPFTKENVFSNEFSSVRNDCFYAIMLDSINMPDISEKIWKSALKTSMKEINENAIDTNSPTAVLAYKASVYDALSVPSVAKAFMEYINSPDFNKRIINPDVKIAMKKSYPIDNDSNVVATINSNINIVKQTILSEMKKSEPLEKGEGMNLSFVSPDNFDDNKNRGGFYFKGDLTKKLLNFNEISDMIFDLVDSVNIPQKNSNDEIEIRTFKPKVIVDELKKTMEEEGISIDAKGKITVDNTDTDFQAPKTMNMIASINNVIKSSFNGVGKEYLDKVLGYNKGTTQKETPTATEKPITAEKPITEEKPTTEEKKKTPTTEQQTTQQSSSFSDENSPDEEFKPTKNIKPFGFKAKRNQSSVLQPDELPLYDEPPVEEYNQDNISDNLGLEDYEQMESDFNDDYEMLGM